MMWFEFHVSNNPVSEINQELFHAWCNDRKMFLKTNEDVKNAISVYAQGVQDYLIDAYNVDANIEDEVKI